MGRTEAFTLVAVQEVGVGRSSVDPKRLQMADLMWVSAVVAYLYWGYI